MATVSTKTDPDRPPVLDSPTRDRLNDLPRSQEQLGNLGRTKLFELIRNGDLASVKIGRRRMIPQSSIDAYVARLRDHAQEQQ